VFRRRRLAGLGLRIAAAFSDLSPDIQLVRLFQNCRYYPSLRSRLRELAKGHSTFAAQVGAFVDFRQNGVHTLLPVDQHAEWAFFTNGDDSEVQRLWAKERGLAPRTSLEDILKAQIEEHRADVFYNLDATGWSRDFIRNLPGCVKHVIAWHAVPLRNAGFSDYDLVVCNFPSILARMRERGCRAEYFFPAYDPAFAPYAARQNRPIDVLFVGGYSRHHRQRALILEAVSNLADRYNIVFHLDRSRLCALAESPLGHLLPLARHRRPPGIMAIAKDPVFGLDYYEALSAAKIVLNGAIDMAGADRGNMRCFEALGSGALLLSDEGNYPEGMKDGETIVTYHSPEHAAEQVKTFLAAEQRRLGLAQAGHEMVSSRYSKEAQWQRFEALVASI
jgi:glycosyltransferase involved in cell wall biosynthesis